MTIYTVKIDKGQWSDSHNWTSAVFDTKEAADKYAEDVTKYYKDTESIPAPYTDREYYDNKLTEEQDIEYERWESRKEDASDFNFARVEEFLLNFPEPKYYEKVNNKGEA